MLFGSADWSNTPPSLKNLPIISSSYRIHRADGRCLIQKYCRRFWPIFLGYLGADTSQRLTAAQAHSIDSQDRLLPPAPVPFSISYRFDNRHWVTGGHGIAWVDNLDFTLAKLFDRQIHLVSKVINTSPIWRCKKVVVARTTTVLDTLGHFLVTV